MTREQIVKEVKDIIHFIAPDEDLSVLDPAQSLRDQLDLDSMDFLDIIMELRKRHKLEVPEADYTQFASLDSSANYLEPRLAVATG